MRRLARVSQRAFAALSTVQFLLPAPAPLLLCLLFGNRFRQGSAACVIFRCENESRPSRRADLKVTGSCALDLSLRVQKWAPNKSNPKNLLNTPFPFFFCSLPASSLSLSGLCTGIQKLFFTKTKNLKLCLQKTV